MAHALSLVCCDDSDGRPVHFGKSVRVSAPAGVVVWTRLASGAWAARCAHLLAGSAVWDAQIAAASERAPSALDEHRSSSNMARRDGRVRVSSVGVPSVCASGSEA